MLSVAILALACILIGIFASGVIIPFVIMPLYKSFETPQIWQSGQVALLVGVSILIGIGIYLAGIKKFRQEDSYIGGERDQDVSRASVMDFYKTISNNNVFSRIYLAAGKKWFDLYDIGKSIVLSGSRIVSSLHTGILPFYITWIISGLIILLIIMLI